MASFTSVLKKIGQVSLAITAKVVGVEGLAEMVFPQKAEQIRQGVDKLQELAAVIVQVEQFGAALSLSGPDKLRAAAPRLAQVILSSELLANGRKIKDKAKFEAAVTGLGSNLADLLNSLSDDGIQTENKAA